MKKILISYDNNSFESGEDSFLLPDCWVITGDASDELVWKAVETIRYAGLDDYSPKIFAHEKHEDFLKNCEALFDLDIEYTSGNSPNNLVLNAAEGTSEGELVRYLVSEDELEGYQSSNPNIIAAEFMF